MEIGETFDFQLTLLPDNRHRLHVNIDLLIMDASSFTLFFDELNALLAGESLPAIDTRYDFRSYLLHQQKINQPLRDDSGALTGWRKHRRFPRARLAAGLRTRHAT